jgi:hypothetical protein
MSDASPKLVAIDEEANDQIVHRCRFGKANGATDSSFNPGAQIDVLALDFLRVRFADRVLIGGDMSLVGPPPIGVKLCDTKGLQQVLEFEKDAILPTPKDRRQHGPAVMINRMPQPPRLRFLAHKTPHLLKLRRQPATLGSLLSTTALPLYLLGVQML